MNKHLTKNIESRIKGITVGLTASNFGQYYLKHVNQIENLDSAETFVLISVDNQMWLQSFAQWAKIVPK